MNKIYLNIIALVGMFLLMSCADEIVSNGATEAADDHAITLSLNSEAQPTSTRTRAISTGSHVNQLIYMIYKKNADGEFEVDNYYLAKNQYKNLECCAVIDEYQPGQQYSIRLIPNPDDKDGQEYKIVCWAQEKDSKYFDLTSFPEKISINYDKDGNGNLICTNNIEELDAFYCSQTFKVSEKGTNVKIVLKRPFAQINVGTSGWDYEGFATIEPDPTVIKYSKMTVSDVATVFSPLNNKCDASELKTITFDWSKLPAYRNLNFEEINEDDITGVYENDHDGNGIFTEAGVEEEFLQLMLESPQKDAYDYPDEKVPDTYTYAPYIGWKEYDRLCAEVTDHDAFLKSIFTETYKYLSMCYVLVPFTVTEDANGNEISRTNSPVRNITFDCAEKSDGKGVLGEDNSVLSLTQVPVGSNCRTNIITTDGTGLFMNSNEMKVAIYSETFSDYYKRLRPKDTMWDDEEDDEEDRNGNLDNNEYVWPGGDLDSEAGKFPMPKPEITMEQSDDRYFSQEENTIKVFAYIDDRDKSFNGEKNNKAGNVSLFTVHTPENDLFDHFEFYLGNKQIGDSYGDYTVTTSVADLTDIISTQNIKKVTDVSNEELQIPYYPVTCTVKTVPIEEAEDYKASNLSVTIKVYPIYDKYTFSEDSKDEGGTIWEKISDKNTGTRNEKSDEIEYGYYFIDGGKEVTATTISVKSRGNSSNKGGNHRLFAMDGRLKFKGAGGFTDKDALNGDAKNVGHYVTLMNLAGSSKITVKVGRDKEQDNSTNPANATKDDPFQYYNRQLKFQYDECTNDNNIAYGYTWKALPLGSPFLNDAEYKYTEDQTKIADGYDVKLSDSGNVKISMTVSGFCFYWIIISETDDDMLKLNY